MEIIEGIGNEVLFFGLGSVVLSVLLYHVAQFMFRSIEADQTSPGTSEMPGRTRTGASDCCICIGETQLGLETNCGHVYCGDCILEVHRRSNGLSAMSCPYCRQRVTILLTYFSEDERNTAEPAEIETRTRILEEAGQYNRRFSGEPRSLMEHLRDLPVLLRHLWTALWTGEGLQTAFQIRVLVLGFVWVAYFLSPLDLLPEALFGIVGLLDDLFVFILISMHITYFFRQIVSNRVNGQADVPGVNQ